MNPPSTVYASSGLLPSWLEEISLVASDLGHGWEAALVARDTEDTRTFDFTGDGDPRGWLAFLLVKDHEFQDAAAIEVARCLFEPFLPPSTASEPPPAPYGMPSTS
jgi:hypothetical protein